jgi:hypothetical protein
MRTLVDIPDRQIDDLAAICAASKLPRAEVIRQAIAAYIATHKAPVGSAFGLWSERAIDGVKYQKTLRSEW